MQSSRSSQSSGRNDVYICPPPYLPAAQFQPVSRPSDPHSVPMPQIAPVELQQPHAMVSAAASQRSNAQLSENMYDPAALARNADAARSAQRWGTVIFIVSIILCVPTRDYYK